MWPRAAWSSTAGSAACWNWYSCPQAPRAVVGHGRPDGASLVGVGPGPARLPHERLLLVDMRTAVGPDFPQASACYYSQIARGVFYGLVLSEEPTAPATVLSVDGHSAAQGRSLCTLATG